MAGGGSGGGGTQTTKVELPWWLDQAAQETWANAKEIGGQEFEAYPGERVAGFTPDQLQAQQGIRGMQGQTAASIAALQGANAPNLGFTPDQVSAGTIPGTNLDAYMNPYLQQVEQGALGALDSQRKQALMGDGDSALSAGAFGGSRHGIMEGVTNAKAAEAAGRLSAGIRSDAFNTALSTATSDLNRGLQAGTANQTAGIAGLQGRLAALGLTGELVNQGQAANIRDISLLDTSGGQQQALNQQGLALGLEDFLTEQGWDRSQAEWLQGMLTRTPYNQTQTVTGNTGTKPNPMMGAAGGAMSGAMAGSTFGPWGTAIGAVGGGLLGYMGSR